MPEVPVNLDDTPDFAIPVSAGEHIMELQSVTVAQNKAGDGQNIVIQGVISEGDDAGRPMRDWISMKNENYAIRWKQLVIAALGKDAATGSVSTEDVEGQTVKIIVTHRTEPDQYTQEDTTRANIARYLPVE